jgi:tetratricopeptide (TPR) repeat protein
MDASLEVVLRKLDVRIRRRDPAAFEEIVRLAEQYPEEPEVWDTLASAHESRGDHAAAIAAYTRAIALSPKVPALLTLFFSRGGCALDIGDLELAVADFSQALVLSDELNWDYLREELHFLRAGILVELGKTAEALADLSHVADDYVSLGAKRRSKADLLVMCGESVPPPKEEAPPSSEPPSYSANLVAESRSVLSESPDEEEAALAKELGEAGLAAVDAALLKHMLDRSLKAARVIWDAVESSGYPVTDQTRVRLYARRLIALAEAGAVIAEGDMHRPGRCHVRLSRRP